MSLEEAMFTVKIFRYTNTKSRSAFYQIFEIQHKSFDRRFVAIHHGKLQGGIHEITRPSNGGAFKQSTVSFEEQAKTRAKNHDYIPQPIVIVHKNEAEMIAMFGAVHFHAIGVALGLVGGDQNPVNAQHNEARAQELAQFVEADPTWGSW